VQINIKISHRLQLLPPPSPRSWPSGPARSSSCR
jgi:hypothetical protein